MLHGVYTPWLSGLTAILQSEQINYFYTLFPVVFYFGTKFSDSSDVPFLQNVSFVQFRILRVI